MMQMYGVFLELCESKFCGKVEWFSAEDRSIVSLNRVNFCGKCDCSVILYGYVKMVYVS